MTNNGVFIGKQMNTFISNTGFSSSDILQGVSTLTVHDVTLQSGFLEKQELVTEPCKMPETTVCVH